MLDQITIEPVVARYGVGIHPLSTGYWVLKFDADNRIIGAHGGGPYGTVYGTRDDAILVADKLNSQLTGQTPLVRVHTGPDPHQPNPATLHHD